MFCCLFLPILMLSHSLFPNFGQGPFPKIDGKALADQYTPGTHHQFQTLNQHLLLAAQTPQGLPSVQSPLKNRFLLFYSI